MFQLLSGLSFVSVWQEEWKSCPGALQDGNFPLRLYGGRLRHEEAALAAGCGAGLREGSPVRRQAQRRLHEAAAALQRHPQRKVRSAAVEMVVDTLYSPIEYEFQEYSLPHLLYSPCHYSQQRHSALWRRKSRDQKSVRKDDGPVDQQPVDEVDRGESEEEDEEEEEEEESSEELEESDEEEVSYTNNIQLHFVSEHPHHNSCLSSNVSRCLRSQDRSLTASRCLRRRSRQQPTPLSK